MAEAEGLARRGSWSSSVVAQDLTAYGQDLPGKVRLHHLLPELCRVEGIRWIRLHYAYPRDFPDALDRGHRPRAQDRQVRGHAAAALVGPAAALHEARTGREVPAALLAKLRDRVPGIAMRTALIVGLPGETEEDFEDLLGFVREQRFERLGVFTYSQEEGTAAAEMDGQIPERVKKARQKKVMALQQRISRDEQRALVGQRLLVLVEGKAEGTDHLLVGRHARQAPEIDGVTYINEFAVPGRRWPTRASSSPSRSPRRGTTTWSARWSPASRGAPAGGSPRDRLPGPWPGSAPRCA